MTQQSHNIRASKPTKALINIYRGNKTIEVVTSKLVSTNSYLAGAIRKKSLLLMQLTQLMCPIIAEAVSSFASICLKKMDLNISNFSLAQLMVRNTWSRISTNNIIVKHEMKFKRSYHRIIARFVNKNALKITPHLVQI